MAESKINKKRFEEMNCDDEYTLLDLTTTRIKYLHKLCGVITEKSLDSFRRNMGCSNQECKNKKTQKTMIKNLGENYKDVIQKNREDSFEKKYGVRNPNKLKEVRDKIKKTNNERYGVNAPMQSEEIKNKLKNTVALNQINKYEKIYKVKPLFNSSEYRGERTVIDNKIEYIHYKWKCITCGCEFENTVKGGIRCPKCFPRMTGTSHTEIDIQEWVESNIPITRNKHFNESKPFKYMYELDIYIPEKNLGIELNGLYTHSEIEGKKDSRYHIDKTNYFKQKGINVIHIWDCEWNYKKDIVKSLILSKLGLIKNKIHGRLCEIKKVSPADSRKFLNENHLQGEVNSSVKLGLYYEDELVSLLTLGKPRYETPHDWEIYRFCNKLNTNINGGFEKLLSYFRKNYSGSIITYCDKRISIGNIYLKSGFSLIRESRPNYYYTSNYKIIENRQNYQKGKLKGILEKFSNELTERQNMYRAGYDILWDCGNYVFELK